MKQHRTDPECSRYRVARARFNKKIVCRFQKTDPGVPVSIRGKQIRGADWERGIRP